ncbi:cation/multidrug efflux pump [Striga asiatica]|uniref:Cation/multidrug efflux pump n=1 Tax=Striga asiatica TaxID=4170 RepID=A0A5A7PHT2_STRAF|nr:cation/multidrug efflux pump [Striga asiatica]
MQHVATQQLFEEEVSGTAGEEPMARLCVFSPKEQSERHVSKTNFSQEKDALVVHKLLEQHQTSQGREMEEQRQVVVGGTAKTSEVETSLEAMEVREEVQLRNNRTWRRAIRQSSTTLKYMEDEGEDQKGKTKKRGRKAGVEIRNGRSTKLTDWNWVVNGPPKIKQGAVGTDIWVAELMANGGRNWDEGLFFLFLMVWCCCVCWTSARVAAFSAFDV